MISKKMNNYLKALKEVSLDAVNITGFFLGFILYFFKIEINILVYIFIIFFIFASIKNIVAKNRKIQLWEDENDIRLYKKIKNEILPVDNILYFLDESCFDCFSHEPVKKLENFCSFCDRPDFVFKDNALNKSKDNLFEKINLFIRSVHHYTCTGDDLDFNTHRIGSHLKDKNYALYMSRLNELQEGAGNLSKTYREFIKLGTEEFGSLID